MMEDFISDNLSTGYSVTALVMLIIPIILGSYWLSKKRHLSPENLMVLITGCDSGLGHAMALYCHKRGFFVVACILDDQSPGTIQLMELAKAAGRMQVLPMDVTDVLSVGEVRSYIRALIKADGNLVFHCLINNAGVMVFGETEWQTDSNVNHQLSVNLAGPIRVTTMFAPLLRKYKGRVINVSSHCAQLPLPAFAVYGATKAGLQAWSDALRVEWSKYGITVISLMPGSFVEQSNILSKQEQHAADMYMEMSSEAKKFYGNYFTTAQTYMSVLSGERPFVPMRCPHLQPILDDALLSLNPRAQYDITPLRYWLYHSLALSPLTPVKLRDWLVVKFAHLPSYTPVN